MKKEMRSDKKTLDRVEKNSKLSGPGKGMRNFGRERLPIDFFHKFVIILYIEPKGDLWERESGDE
jgi:hypothetical protein